MTAILAALSALRRVPFEAWVALGLIAGYLAFHAAHVRHDKRLDAQGYARALAKANDVQGFLFPAERASLQRRIDSLSKLTAKRDTVLVARIRTVRELLTDTLHDTTVVYREAVRNACTALANDCDAYRKHARETIDAATQQATMERNANVALSFQLVAARDDLTDARTSFARQAKWRNAERGVCAGVVTASLIWGATR